MNVELILALDFPSKVTALAFVDVIGKECDFYKVGMELYTACGPDIVSALRDRGKRVFLDLKFHDIPNTVRGAARSAARLGCELITVHASGGTAMLEAAREGAREGSQGGSGSPCKVFAVSVLTSLDDASLREAWGRIDRVSSSDEVLRLARMTADAGLDGLVCSAHEAAAVHAALGERLELLVPGIRLNAGGSIDADDQARVATPRAAMEAGARYLILGRAVSLSTDPAGIMRSVRAYLLSLDRAS